jgi:hypothetical protein
MVARQQRQHCLNNLALMLLADGEVSPQEMDFLQKAAGVLGVESDDWPGYLRSMEKDETTVYPIEDRSFARKVLSAMAEMARRDGKYDAAEQQLLHLFVKACALSTEEVADILPPAPGQSPQPDGGAQQRMLVVTTDFEAVDTLVTVLERCGVVVATREYQEVLHGHALGDHTIVCLHGAVEKDTTIKRCDNLLHSYPGLTVVPILGRYQGHQVKYLHEIGIPRCIVEPVFPADVTHILEDAKEKRSKLKVES